ncbi:MAG TPA: FAD-dependent oxidoreductase [Anaerolineales bacterium]|nr:FAD-dependent oxidoreductase [Anaerolineales bacterium]
MKNYKYLIIGGGMTGDAVVKGIRERDTQSSIGMIGTETDMPYSRPPLTKGMWKGRPLEKIWRGTDKHNVEFHLGRTVTRINLAAKRVQDLEGEEYGYEKLLLATGGSTNRLPFGGEDIIYYRTLKNYLRLRALADEKERFLVIGAGFIGSEIAAALTMLGKHVFMVFRGNSIGENIYPKDLSSFLNDHYRFKGVELVPGDEVSGVEKIGEGFKVRTRNGLVFEVDAVVAGLGVRPNIDLAKSAGLQVDDGILVNDRLQTSATDIYAAGDVAMFPHFTLKKLMRVEHEDNALKMGKQAGRNMAGADEAYTHTPNFYSDLFEFGYEAVGELSAKLEMVEDWQEPRRKGAVYYLADGRVRGVLMWNMRDKVKDATDLMAEAGPFKAEDLKGRIS